MIKDGVLHQKIRDIKKIHVNPEEITAIFNKALVLGKNYLKANHHTTQFNEDPGEWSVDEFTNKTAAP